MPFANRIVAHRGWSGRAPENTAAAFRLAFSRPYVSGVELDVQLTKDRVPVVIHDFTLERTTNGTGLVGDHTYDQLRRLDAGGWFSERYRGEPIPTLAKALEIAKGRGIVNVELKTTGSLYPGLAERSIEVIRRLGMEKDVFLTSFDHAVVKEASGLAPDIQSGLLFSRRPILVTEQLKAAGATWISVAHPHVTKRLAEEAREQGFGLMAWTVDEAERVRQIAELGAEIVICTNHPDRAAEALGRKE